MASALMLKNYKVVEQSYEILISPSLFPLVLGLVFLPLFLIIFFHEFFLHFIKSFDAEYVKTLFQRNPFNFIILLVVVFSIGFNFAPLLKILVTGRVRVDRVSRTIYKNSQPVTAFDEIAQIKTSVKLPIFSRKATLLLLLKSGRTIKLLTGNNPGELKEIAQKIGAMIGITVESN